MIKLLFITTCLGFASSAYAGDLPAPTDFRKVSMVAQELSKYPYDAKGAQPVNGSFGAFSGGNCQDFTIEADTRLREQGFTDIKWVILTTGSVSHMVPLVNDAYVLNAGPAGVTIHAASWMYTWDLVEGAENE